MKMRKLRGGFTLSFPYYGRVELLSVLYEEGIGRKNVKEYLEQKHLEIHTAWDLAAFFGDRVVVMKGPQGLYSQIQDANNHFAPVD